MEYLFKVICSDHKKLEISAEIMSYLVSTNYLYEKVVELSYTVTELYWRSASLLASSVPIEVEVISILLASSSFHKLEVSFASLLFLPCDGGKLYWPPLSPMRWR